MMNESKEVDINKLIVRIESKLEEFKRINDNSHNLLNYYFDQLIEEINTQSYQAYRMLSDHFNYMTNFVIGMKNELLNSVPNEPLNTSMVFWTMNAEELLESNNWPTRNWLDIFKQEQDLTAIITKKLYEYLDFKKALLVPIKDDIDMNSIFGQLIIKDFFHLRVPRSKFKFLTVSIDGSFRKWISNKYECVETFESNEDVTFSKIINRNTLLTIGESVKFWDINSFKLIKCLPKFINFVDSYKLDGNKIFVSFENGILESWNIETEQCDFSIAAHDELVTSIKLLANKYIVTAGKDSKIHLWNYHTGEKIRSFQAHTNKVCRLKIISETSFASCSADKTSCIWDIESGKCLRMLVGHQNKVLNMKYVDNTLVTGSLDCTIRYWDVSSGKNTQILRRHTNGIAYLKLFTEDNILVSTSVDRLILLWDFKNGQCLRELAGHENFILDVKKISAELFLSASHDGTVKLWNLDNSSPLASYQNCFSAIMNVHKIDK